MRRPSGCRGVTQRGTLELNLLNAQTSWSVTICPPHPTASIRIHLRKEHDVSKTYYLVLYAARVLHRMNKYSTRPQQVLRFPTSSAFGQPHGLATPSAALAG